jgi:hypothetical protein
MLNLEIFQNSDFVIKYSIKVKFNKFQIPIKINNFTQKSNTYINDIVEHVWSPTPNLSRRMWVKMGVKVHKRD